MRSPAFCVNRIWLSALALLDGLEQVKAYDWKFVLPRWGRFVGERGGRPA